MQLGYKNELAQISILEIKYSCFLILAYNIGYKNRTRHYNMDSVGKLTWVAEKITKAKQMDEIDRYSNMMT